MKVVAKKIKNSYCDYLTEGKAYKANLKSDYFTVTDDEGDTITCNYKNCPHTESDWTIIGNPFVTVKKCLDS